MEQQNQSPYSLSTLVSYLNNNFSMVVLIIIVFVAGFLGGSLWTENQTLKKGGTGSAKVANAPVEDTGPTEETLKKVPAVTNSDHIRGKKDAKVVLIEYSDYECPFCNRFHPTMKQVLEKYGDKVAWVLRDYPLPIHANAQKAAEAAECVAKYGNSDKFWKFSDLVYEKVGSVGPTVLETEALMKLVTEAGADANKVKACVEKGEMADAVKKEMAGGSTAGIQGTPGTIIVSGGKYELIPGALPLDQVTALIDKYLK